MGCSGPVTSEQEYAVGVCEAYVDGDDDYFDDDDDMTFYYTAQCSPASILAGNDGGSNADDDNGDDDSAHMAGFSWTAAFMALVASCALMREA